MSIRCSEIEEGRNEQREVRIDPELIHGCVVGFLDQHGSLLLIGPLAARGEWPRFRG